VGPTLHVLLEREGETLKGEESGEEAVLGLSVYFSIKHSCQLPGPAISN
jgi:hypothetical protein